MGFQYDTVPRSTEVERKLAELKNLDTKRYNEEIKKSVQVKVKESLNLNLKPNENFIKAHKEREKQKEIEKKKEEFLNSIDEKGYKLEKIYNNQEFIKLHDPLNLYSNKKNYDDLAWKVYNDVNPDDSFLKTLYYPKLRSEDYNSLVSKFSSVHEMNGYRTKFILINSVIGGIAGYFLSSKLNFKYRTTLLITGLSTYSAYSIFNCLFLKKVKRALNNFASSEISPKYDELKFLKVTYGKIN
jgi:hypothetical protein